MPFCGQCGFQLPPRVNHCPRCGAATEMNTSLEEAHPNNPTVAFLPPLNAPTVQSTQPAQWPTALPTVPSTPAPAGQQKLDIRPDSSSYDASQLTNAPTYQISNTPPAPVSQPGLGSSYPSYPDYTPTSGANYPPQRGDTSYPGFQAQQPQSSPGFMSPGGAIYQPISNSFGGGQQTPQQRGKAGLIVLLVLLAILIIAGVAGAFVLKQPAFLFNNGTGTATATTGTGTGKGTATKTTPTVAPSPSPIPLTQQAQTLVQHYYDDINNKNYAASYALLGSQMQQNQQSYDQYTAGFADTQQDAITITSTSQQADGTVRVDLTLQATHTDSTQQTYQGYYIVGPENGSLKILSGQFQQTA